MDPHAAATKGGVWESELLLYVNGQRTAITHAPPEMTLLQYLRQAGLTGTKLGCGEVGGDPRCYECVCIVQGDRLVEESSN
jgi:xanthine dehydrogenase/oxidase